MRTLILLLGMILVCACVSNPYQANIGGHTITFRANLHKAASVPLSDDIAIKEILLNPHLSKIIIAFVPDEKYNAYYLVTGYELSYKLSLIWHTRYGYAPKIEALQLNSTKQAKSYATELSPVILLFANANQTAVDVNGYLVTVMGKDMNEQNRDYTDLDLSADKLLLTLIE